MKLITTDNVVGQSSGRGLEVLATPWIDETLSLYRAEYRTVLSASTTGLTTHAMFSCFDYPFTEPGHIDYVTASLAMLLVSQLGYLHVRSGIERHVTAEGNGLGTEDFFAARDQGSIIFGDISIRFKKRIPVNAPFSGTMTHANARRLPSAVVSRFSFGFAENAAFGSGTCFFLIP